MHDDNKIATKKKNSMTKKSIKIWFNNLSNLPRKPTIDKNSKSNQGRIFLHLVLGFFNKTKKQTVNRESSMQILALLLLSCCALHYFIFLYFV